jgi:hypothetical protein
MTITTNRNRNGGLVLSAVVGGYLVSRQYYGYTKREALKLFRSELKTEKGN